MSVPPSPVPSGATAERPAWAVLPAPVRAGIEAALGRPVASAQSQGGGFTSGFASRLLLADGERVFVKAVSRAAHPVVHSAYQQEHAVARALPAAVPAPRLLWSTEVCAGPHDSWLVLAFEDVAGQAPRRPWQPLELDAVLGTLPGLARALTPPPTGLPPLPGMATALQPDLWRRARAGQVEALALAPVAARPWTARLAALEESWTAHARGDTAGHFDLRDDNLLLAADGRVLVCDWNWLAVGPPWVDLAGLLVSVHGDGLDADAVLGTHPLSRDVAPAAVDSHLAALAAYFTEAAARPPVPGSPWLRVHQAWYRDATLSWLLQRWSA